MAALETGRTSWAAVLDAVRLQPGADVTHGEWREIRFYGITTLGGALFNAWD
ncbi:hypothetical protein ACIQRE_00375 [Streptomyces griseoluteus]|uniref:hypothetical protein n=1 Tax=Streptomyces griseoluteus TaxID=29306 RepID=UPI00382DB0E3